MDSGLNNNFPLEMKDVAPEQAEHLMKYFTGKYLNYLTFVLTS